MDAPSHLLHNMVLFGRLLRLPGVDVTTERIAHWIEAVRYISVWDRADFKNAARALLVTRREDLPVFETLFDLFWQGRRETEPLELGELLQRAAQVRRRLGVDSGESGDPGRQKESGRDQEGDLPGYSSVERLRQKDFAELAPDELAEVSRLMRGMFWEPELRRSRRRIPSPKGSRLDLRRTLRRNLRLGGEPVHLRWRTVKVKPRPLVVLCDISGSMEIYSRILLQFLYVLGRDLRAVEVFAFGTRLTRLTSHFQQRNIEAALAEAAQAIPDWGGGTRIGESLKAFNYDWGRRVLSRGAIVLIISDGWDRGEIPLLEREIARLQRSCHRLLWLNPLLGSSRYQPINAGMRAVLPRVDDFLPVHNLSSLEQLGEALQRLNRRRSPQPRALPGRPLAKEAPGEISLPFAASRRE